MKTETKDKIMDLIVDIIVVGILCAFAAGVMQVIFILFEWSTK